MPNIIKNKKIIMILILILLIPLIIPIVEIIIDCLFYMGKYAGTWIRGLKEIGMC